MSQRAAAGQQSVQLGDEFWFILKTVPGPGTDIGVGGYQSTGRMCKSSSAVFARE